MIRAAKALAVTLAVLPAAAAAHCTQLVHDANPYTICEVAAEDDLRLFLNDPDGATLGSFERIEAELAGQGQTLGFAMNAGMYHPDRSPVGLYVEEGEEQARIVTAAGPGNFGMLPNGVFCILPDGYAVVESRAFADRPRDCRYATQSGPMLVVDGALHPRFLAGSDSRLIRNGVGVSADGSRAYFAISDRPVNFHEFGRLFRDELGAPQALYFDGNVSRLHAPDMGRSDWGRQMGPVVGLVVPQGAGATAADEGVAGEGG
jgi:uncharacterized protein YigE (DUF2233 family)